MKTSKLPSLGQVGQFHTLACHDMSCHVMSAATGIVVFCWPSVVGELVARSEMRVQPEAPIFTRK